MSKLIYNPTRPYQIDINDLIEAQSGDLIEKGRALPIGTLRTWGGQDYVKHADGWVHVGSGKLTSGKKMEVVEGHANSKDHSDLAQTHAKAKASGSSASGSTSQKEESSKKKAASSKKEPAPAKAPKTQGKIESYEKEVKVFHSTDTEPRISTVEDRLIPNTISTSKEESHVWGSKTYQLTIPKGTKVLKIDRNSFFEYGEEVDTPKNRGKAIFEHAKKEGVDVIEIAGVIPGIKVEYAILNMDVFSDTKLTGDRSPIGKLTELKEQYEKEGQKAGAKVIDKKIKELKTKE